MKWILLVLAIAAVVFLQLKPSKVGVKRGGDGLYYKAGETNVYTCLLYTSPSPRDRG